MSRNVSRFLPILRLLAKTKNARVRRAILESSDPAVITAISECSLNVLRNRVKLSAKEKKRLYRHRQHLRQLARWGSSLASHRKFLVSQRGGFLPLLLTPVLSLLGGLLGRAIGKRI